MRASLLLLGLLCACTVVPTPEVTGVGDGSANIVGTWRAQSRYNSDSLIERLAIFSDGSYERAAVDSSPVRGNQLVLSEAGIWSNLPDTTQILFSPQSRQTWPSTSASLGPAPTTPDTARVLFSSDVLTLVLPRWYQRDSLEILVYHRD
jgi:hypothetical protein